MKFLASIYLLFSMLTSCTTNKTVRYTYNGVTITRIDFDGATNFYYGNCNYEKSCSTTDYIKSEYYGFNNGMDIYLVFKKDGKVELIHFGGEYLTRVGNCTIELPNYSNDKLDVILNKYKKSGIGMIRISNSIKLEQEFSENENSKVSIQYE